MKLRTKFTLCVSLALSTLAVAGAGALHYSAGTDSPTCVLLGGVFLLAALTTTFWAAEVFFCAPLRRIGKQMRWVAAYAAYDQTLEEAGRKDELALPAEAFNDLLFAVRHSLSAAREVNDQLERHVERRTAQIAAQHAELAATRQSALDCIVTLDGRGRVTEFNPAAEQTFGLSRDKVLGKRLADVVRSGSLAPVPAADILSRRVEATGLRAGAGEFPVEMAVVLIRPPTAAEPAPRASANTYIVYLRDVSDRRKAEEQAREAEKLALVAKFTDNAVVITDVGGRIEWVNEGFTRITGYEPSEVMGRKPGSFLQGPDTDPQTVGRVRRHVAAGEGFSVELVNYSKTGRPYWLAISVQPIRDDAGRVVRFIAIESDVTEAKRAEEALRASQAQYERMAANVPGMVYQFLLRADGSTSFPFVSDGARQVYGVEPDAIRRDPNALIGIIHPEDVASFGATVAESARTLGPWDWKGRFVRPGAGTVQWVQCVSRPQRHANGDILWDGIVTDISVLKQAEVELKEAGSAAESARRAAEAASRAKSEFLANMSHEIRTPLNGVIGMADLLLGTPLSDRQGHYARVVKSSADALLSLINQILDFSKIEAGKLELESADFDLAVTVEDVAEILAAKASKKGLELACHVERVVPRALRGDADRLRQILINLVNNALKFTDRGEVVLRVGLEGAADAAGPVVLRFAVQDTGIGIPPERLDRLFKSFSQVDASTTRKYGGTGLGLAISKQLAELMGGRIGVDSVQGKGSTFWFTARFERQAVVESAGAPPPPQGAQSRPSRLVEAVRALRVLVVDDNATHRQILCDYLAHWGLTAGSAAGPEEAMLLMRAAATRGERFGAALVDLLMPGMSGLELGRAIGAEPGIACALFLMLTSVDSAGVDTEAVRAAGFVGHLTKPLRQSQLFDALIRVVGAGAPAATPPPAAPPLPAGKAAPTARILLAEDNEVNQMVAGEVLARAGYAYDIVGNGREAVAALEARPYDLVLMDCQMPEMDGFEAAALVRVREREGKLAGGRASRLPVVALTANAVKGDRERCLDAGMDAYLTKPLNAAEMIRTIESLLPPAGAVVKRVEVIQPPAPPASDLPPFDGPALLGRCMGDSAFVERILAKFREQSAAMLERLVRDAAGRDAAAVSKSAHAFKGSAANLSAEPLRRAAAALEDMGRAGALDGLEDKVECLRRELERCIAFIPKVGAGLADKDSGALTGH